MVTVDDRAFAPAACIILQSLRNFPRVVRRHTVYHSTEQLRQQQITVQRRVNHVKGHKVALHADLGTCGSDEARLVRVVMIDVHDSLDLLLNELREGDAHVSRLIASETKPRQVITLDVDVWNSKPAL